MADDIEMKSRRKSHVGFESERLLLLAPATQGPMHWKRARQQANGKTGILEPARGKIKRGLQPRTAGLPSQIHQAAFAQACRLHRLQHTARATPVVAHKPAIPGKG